MEDLIKQLLAAAAGISLVPSAGTAVPLAAVPEGVSLQSLERFLPAPTRLRGTTTLHRMSDFVEYVNAFKQSGARIFVNPTLEFASGGKLADAYLDFPAPGTPGWVTHTVTLIVSPSLEYRLLTNLEKAGLHDQAAFALKLRDIAHLCTSLSSADLVEIAQTLTLSSKGEFASVEDNFSGSVRFGYDVQVTARSEATTRKNVEVPREIGFSMPLLMGGEVQTLTAELLYRQPSQAGGKVQMGIRLPDRQFIERAVLEQTAESLASKCALPVAMGCTDVPDEVGIPE